MWRREVDKWLFLFNLGFNFTFRFNLFFLFFGFLIAAFYLCIRTKKKETDFKMNSSLFLFWNIETTTDAWRTYFIAVWFGLFNKPNIATTFHQFISLFLVRLQITFNWLFFFRSFATQLNVKYCFFSLSFLSHS